MKEMGVEQVFGYIPPRAVSHTVCLDCGRGMSVRLHDGDEMRCPGCASDNVYLITASNEEGERR